MASCTKARMASSLLMPKTPRGLRLGGRNRLRLASLIPRALSLPISPTLPFLLLRIDPIRNRSDKFEPSPPRLWSTTPSLETPLIITITCNAPSMSTTRPHPKAFPPFHVLVNTVLTNLLASPKKLFSLPPLRSVSRYARLSKKFPTSHFRARFPFSVGVSFHLVFLFTILPQPEERCSPFTLRSSFHALTVSSFFISSVDARSYPLSGTAVIPAVSFLPIPIRPASIFPLGHSPLLFIVVALSCQPLAHPI